MKEIPSWRPKNATTVTERSFSQLETGPRFITTASSSDGILLRMKEADHIFRMRGGKRDYITPREFTGRGFDENDVVTVTPRLIKTLPPAAGIQHISLQKAAQNERITIESTGNFFQRIANFTAGPFDTHTAINIEKGDVFLSKEGRQSLVVTQDFEVFAPKGKQVSLKGVWGACIDRFRQWPQKGEILDVTRNATNWNLASASKLVDLVNVIDRRNVRGEQHAQDAVWRITDQQPVEAEAEKLLQAADITSTLHTNFPHLNNPSTASTTEFVLPPALSLRGVVASHTEECPRNTEAPDSLVCKEELQTAARYYLQQKPFPGTTGQQIDSRVLTMLLSHYRTSTPTTSPTPRLAQETINETAVSLIRSLQQKGYNPPPLHVEEVHTVPRDVVAQERMQFVAEGDGIRRITVTVQNALTNETVFTSTPTFGSILTWNGKRDDSTPIKNGVYKFRITATGWHGETFQSEFQQFILKRQSPFGN